MPDRPDVEPSPFAGRTTAQRRRRALAIALPATGTLIADPLLGVLDTAIVGRVGTAELGALGLSVAILGAVSWIFNFLVTGTTTEVAKATGAGDLTAGSRRVTNAAVVAVSIGLVVAVLLLVAAPALVRAFGAVDELVDPAVLYLRIRAVGVPLFLLGYVGHGAFRGIGDTRTTLRVVVVANVVNAVLTVLLALVLDFGLAGAAWATVAAEAGAVAQFVLLLRRAGMPLLAGSGRLRDRLPTGAEVRALAAVSRDLFLRTGGLVGGFLLITAAASRVDAETAAAHQVLWQSWLLVAFFTDGLAIAAQTMIGNALGAGDHDEAHLIGHDLTRFGIVVGIGLAGLLIALEPVLPGVFTDRPGVIAAIGATWVLAHGLHVVNAPLFVLDGILMGAEDYAFIRTWTAGPALVAGVLAQVAVTMGGGLFEVWLALTVMMVGRAVPLALRLRSDRWVGEGVTVTH